MFLKTLPKEFCLLRSLKYLVLIDLLESLPDCFGDLINLEHLDLSKSTKLKMLPNSFGNLIRLKHLCLSACRNLTMSAQTLGNIRTLEHLDLSYCERLEVLPQQVAHQRSLIRLNLLGTNLKELPSGMGELSDLGWYEVQYSRLFVLFINAYIFICIMCIMWLINFLYFLMDYCKENPNTYEVQDYIWDSN